MRGQLTANIVLGALYATGLRIVDIRLAVPIGVMTGMLAFVPYIGFGCGLTLAVAMASLDWQGPGRLVGVLAVMLGVQVLDGMVITPRIVGRSVGLAPLEVLLTMMAAGTLFGFLGVLLAVPLGAVVKILVQRGVKAYLRSNFYGRPGSMPGSARLKENLPMSDVVLVETVGATRIVTINRPEARNALTRAVLAGVTEASDRPPRPTARCGASC